MKSSVVLLLLFVGVVVSYDAICSNNGMFYSDTRVCECFQCFSGLNCSVVNEKCVVDVAPGDPGIYQEYWYKERVTLLQETPSYRSPYQNYIPYPPDSATNSNVPDGIHKALVPKIQRLHRMYQNAVTDGRYIVPSYGCTELLSATAYAFSEMRRQQSKNNTMIQVYAKTPYYNGYPNMAYLFPGRMQFTSSDGISSQDNVMEIITYPNNPTGDFREPTYGDAFHVYDSVYLWPSLVNCSAPLDVDVVLFSMSKATGHAGTRFGWALVKDKNFADLMADYINRATLPISVDAQHRTLVLLTDLLARPYNLFNFIHTEMSKRWTEALGYLQRQPQRFNQVSAPGTFYMLVECLAEQEKNNCYNVFLGAGIKGEPGSLFGLPGSYVRIEMVCQEPVYRIFMKNLDGLTSS